MAFARSPYQAGPLIDTPALCVVSRPMETQDVISAACCATPPLTGPSPQAVCGPITRCLRLIIHTSMGHWNMMNTSTVVATLSCTHSNAVHRRKRSAGRRRKRKHSRWLTTFSCCPVTSAHQRRQSRASAISLHVLSASSAAAPAPVAAPASTAWRKNLSTTNSPVESGSTLL
jgi:hypothetical protein